MELREEGHSLRGLQDPLEFIRVLEGVTESQGESPYRIAPAPGYVPSPSPPWVCVPVVVSLPKWPTQLIKPPRLTWRVLDLWGLVRIPDPIAPDGCTDPAEGAFALQPGGIVGGPPTLGTNDLAGGGVGGRGCLVHSGVTSTVCTGICLAAPDSGRSPRAVCLAM